MFSQTFAKTFAMKANQKHLSVHRMKLSLDFTKFKTFT